jgi:NUDIX domain
MEKRYGADKERRVTRGIGWEKFKDILQSRNPELNIEKILEKPVMKKDPVVSFGIIEFSIGTNSAGQPCAFYHVFRRRNTIEYDTILRGFSQKYQVFDLISLLSRDERERIITHTWEELWNDFWIDPTTSQYSSLQAQSKRKFDEIRDILIELDNELPCRISERPYIFPKGKPAKNEAGLDAALREAREETRSLYTEGYLYFNSPIVQKYIGSDDRQYTDYYYVWYQEKVYSCPKVKLVSTVNPRAEFCTPKPAPIPVAVMTIDQRTEEPSEIITRAEIERLLSTASEMLNSPKEAHSSEKSNVRTEDPNDTTPPDEIPDNPISLGDYVTNRMAHASQLSSPRKDVELVPQIRTETISHELESDAWVEIPIFRSAKERLEWASSIDPFREFRIFRRHFQAIMEIHQFLDKSPSSRMSSL